ncbi:hypothetical protein BX616_009402, partial [Lobosporangium transversale]
IMVMSLLERLLRPSLSSLIRVRPISGSLQRIATRLLACCTNVSILKNPRHSVLTAPNSQSSTAPGRWKESSVTIMSGLGASSSRPRTLESLSRSPAWPLFLVNLTASLDWVIIQSRSWALFRHFIV